MIDVTWLYIVKYLTTFDGIQLFNQSLLLAELPYKGCA